MNAGAWPEGYDLTANSPTHPLAVANKAAHANDPSFGGFLPFDCNCGDDALCSCASNKSFTHYVAGGQLVAKPDLVMKVNGQVVVSSEEAPVTLTPGATFTFSLESNVPDGTSVGLDFIGARLAPVLPTLTFTNGVASCSLQAPSQGVTSRVCQRQMIKLLKPFNLYVLGWA